jgi:hypothetical protein
MQVGHASDGLDEENGNDAAVSDTKPLRSAKTGDDASADAFVTDILDQIVPGNPKKALGLIAGFIIFALLIGLWSMGSIGFAMPPAESPAEAAADFVPKVPKIKSGAGKRKPSLRVPSQPAAPSPQEAAEDGNQEALGEEEETETAEGRDGEDAGNAEAESDYSENAEGSDSADGDGEPSKLEEAFANEEREADQEREQDGGADEATSEGSEAEDAAAEQETAASQGPPAEGADEDPRVGDFPEDADGGSDGEENLR